ncbi:hypothetical protein [Butyrivibrio sp. AE2032]|uniref:hypothetical protein n=1 Tax=Butyrivibrio sp. AE2032 TaxID=1458463 RepID=UPI000552313B|nr:hypothetical protein [Butyrivibrio sp. AE2032]
MSIKKFIASALTAGFMLSFIPATAMADSTGWQQVESGWRYYTSASDYVKNAWQEDAGKWYYFDEDGFAVINDWRFIDGKLYHFNNSGAMETNKWIDCGPYVLNGPTGFEDTIQYKQFSNKRKWRYVGSNGAAYTGWKTIGGKYYYFDYQYSSKEDGEYQYISYYGDINHYGYMHYQFLYDNVTGDVYYFDNNGQYCHDCFIEYDSYDGDGMYHRDRYYFGNDGKEYDGWNKIDGKWYFCGPEIFTGARLVEYKNGNGEYVAERYFFDKDGVMQTGWCQNDKFSLWYYAGSNGLLLKNEWLYDNGKWYYFDNNSCWMLADCENVEINGKYYSFDKNGVCKNPSGISPNKLNGWFKAWDQTEISYNEDKNTYSINQIYFWYYFLSGNKVTGWKQISGKWYYFSKDNGKMAAAHGTLKNDKIYIDGKYYCFNKNGEMQTGWSLVNRFDPGRWVYSKSNGVCYQEKWLYSSGVWYYFDKYAYMVSDVYNVLIDGKYYDFDQNGACINPEGRDYPIAS